MYCNLIANPNKTTMTGNPWKVHKDIAHCNYHHPHSSAQFRGCHRAGWAEILILIILWKKRVSSVGLAPDISWRRLQSAGSSFSQCLFLFSSAVHPLGVSIWCNYTRAVISRSSLTLKEKELGMRLICAFITVLITVTAFPLGQFPEFALGLGWAEGQVKHHEGWLG